MNGLSIPLIAAFIAQVRSAAFQPSAAYHRTTGSAAASCLLKKLAF